MPKASWTRPRCASAKSCCFYRPYVVLAIRAALPLVMEPVQVFAGVSLVLALVGWPIVARGVRAIIAVESTRDYVEAARAAGASPARIIRRHLLPAIAGFLTLQAALLLPAFVIAEATLSLAGFGFAEPTPSWGTMLQDAANVGARGISLAAHSLPRWLSFQRPCSRRRGPRLRASPATAAAPIR